VHEHSAALIIGLTDGEGDSHLIAPEQTALDIHPFMAVYSTNT